MFKKSLIVALATVLILGFSGWVLAGVLSIRVEFKDGSVVVKEYDIEDVVSIQMDIAEDALFVPTPKTIDGTAWKLESPAYVITGKLSPQGVGEFHGAIDKFLGGRVSSLGGYPLTGGIERQLKNIRKSNTIILILQGTVEVRELQELEEKYPELLPISYEQLALYSFPILYFAQKGDRVRGIIIAKSVDSSLAELLLVKGIPLDTPLRYENGSLEEIESSK